MIGPVLDRRRFGALVGGIALAGLTPARAAAPLHHPTGSQITLAWPTEPTLDDGFVQHWLFEGLTRLGAERRVEPGIADSWRVSEDGRFLELTLRDGASFSDGKPCDSRAVLSSLVARAGGELVALQAPDPRLIRITPRFPMADLPRRLATDPRFKIRGQDPWIGSGSFMLDRDGRDAPTRFAPNARHPGPLPRLERVIVQPIPSAEQRVLALEIGAVDLIYGDAAISTATLIELGETRLFAFHASPPIGTRRLMMNATRPPTNDPNVRQALALGLDRAPILAALLGVEDAAEGAFDPAAASTLLDGAGWRLGTSGGVRSRDGIPLTLDLAHDPRSAAEIAISGAIEPALGAIGIGVAPSPAGALDAPHLRLDVVGLDHDAESGAVPLTQARTLAVIQRGIKGFIFRPEPDDIAVDLMGT